jgi:hypothetical protein
VWSFCGIDMAVPTYRHLLDKEILPSHDTSTILLTRL